MDGYSAGLVCLAGLSAAPAIAQATTAADPKRFEAEIQRFDESDRTTPVVPGRAQQPAYLTFVDGFTPMRGGDGKPRPELDVQDGLHMTRAGYEIGRRVLAPALEPSSGGQR